MLIWFRRHPRRWLPVLFVGVLAVLLLLFPPRWGFRLAARLAPGAVYFAETTQKVVALTIDDGPSPRTTTQILDQLDQFGVRATFFLLSDNIDGEEESVARLVDAGHELGNHLTVDEASIRLSTQEFQQKLITADAALSQYGPVLWWRPGMGWYNARMVQVGQQAGYRLALGSVFPYDTHVPWTGFTTWFVLANVQPGDIIVLHDGPRRGQRTVDVLEQILPRLKNKDYAVVTLSDLFESDAAMARSHHSTSQ